MLAELGDLRSLFFHPGDQSLQLHLQGFPVPAMWRRLDLLHQLLMLAEGRHPLTLARGRALARGGLRRDAARVQTHLSQLVLQGQEQVGQQARRHLRPLPLLGGVGGGGGGGRELFREVFLDSACRFVQSADLLAEPGLVVLHHVKDALNVGVDRMAGAG